MNGQGRLQGASRAIAPPGDAQEDWQIFVNVGVALGAPLTYTSSQESAPRSPRRCRTRTLRGADQPGVRAAGVGAALAAGVEPVRALEVGLHVPGPAAGEVRRQARRDRFRALPVIPTTERRSNLRAGLPRHRRPSDHAATRFRLRADRPRARRCRRRPARAGRAAAARAGHAARREDASRAGATVRRRAEGDAARRPARQSEQAARPDA